MLYTAPKIYKPPSSYRRTLSLCWVGSTKASRCDADDGIGKIKNKINFGMFSVARGDPVERFSAPGVGAVGHEALAYSCTSLWERESSYWYCCAMKTHNLLGWGGVSRCLSGGVELILPMTPSRRDMIQIGERLYAVKRGDITSPTMTAKVVVGSMLLSTPMKRSLRLRTSCAKPGKFRHARRRFIMFSWARKSRPSHPDTREYLFPPYSTSSVGGRGGLLPEFLFLLSFPLFSRPRVGLATV